MRKNLFVMVAAIALSVGISEQADAAKKVYKPTVDKGELEVEYKGDYDIDEDSDVDGAWKQKIGVGYGVTDYWFTEAMAEFEREGESGSDPEMTAIE